MMNLHLFLFCNLTHFLFCSSFSHVVHFIIDSIFGKCAFTQSCISKHALKTEVFVYVWPVDTCVGEIKVAELFW